MNIPLRFAIALFLATLVIVIAVILGDYGPWYFSWLLGSGFMVLVATAGAVLLDAQDEARRRSTKT
jgi:predicted outer membrane lipoprotein